MNTMAVNNCAPRVTRYKCFVCCLGYFCWRCPLYVTGPIELQGGTGHALVTLY